MTVWPSEEPRFKKLSDEDINNMDKDAVEKQLRIDSRNRFNYKAKIGLYCAFAIAYGFLVAILPIMLVYRILIFAFVFLLVWLSIRVYRKLVREVQPQIAKLLQRASEISITRN